MSNLTCSGNNCKKVETCKHALGYTDNIEKKFIISYACISGGYEYYIPTVNNIKQK